MRIRIENLGRVLIFSSCCLETFIEVFKDNEERFQAVGREIEADARGTDDGEMDLCGVDTCSFLVLSKMLMLWATVVCLASCSNSSLGCKVSKEEEFEVGKGTEEFLLGKAYTYLSRECVRLCVCVAFSHRYPRCQKKSS